MFKELSPLKTVDFHTASATKCHSWLHPASPMMYSPELHNCFFANPSLFTLGFFCFSLDSAWRKHGNHKQHIWQIFTLAMVKITIPSQKSILASGIFSSHGIILRLLLPRLASYHFRSLYFHSVQHAKFYC